MKRLRIWIGCLLCLLLLLSGNVFAADAPPSQAGTRKLEGGQRDFLWPVPGNYNLSSCFLDNRAHYSLDIAAPKGSQVVASYAGTVIDIFAGCEHNWGKSGNCCSSWGNYVLLEHSYRLQNGQNITLYSRYAHLTAVSVQVGQAVSAGEKIGTVGSTGRSSGPHLDYEILYGGTYPSKTYSLDPYINDLLELPEELHTTFGQCCQEYVAYVKRYYPRCPHEQFDWQGNCTACGYGFNWRATWDCDAMGYYVLSESAAAMPIPYARTDGCALQAGQEVAVNATVVNGSGEIWYEVAMENGENGYIPQNKLTFQSYFPSEIQGTLSTLWEGQVLQQGSHRLDGTITSRYPLRTLTGYLDAQVYASWSGKGSVRQIELRGTDLNKKLTFSTIAAGKHTLTIWASDSTGREAAQILSCTFYVEKSTEAETVTVVYEMQPQVQVTVTKGQALGTLPTLQEEGKRFLGWFTAPDGGTAVSESTVIREDTVLYPRWETVICRVSIAGEEREIAYGDPIAAFPEVTREGYRVTGWFRTDGAQVTEETIVTADWELLPQWAPMQYRLTFSTGTKECTLEDRTVTFGTAYGELPQPDRKGYRFVGWQVDGQMVTQNMLVEIPGDHTLFAVWEQESNGGWWWIPVIVGSLIAAGAVLYGYRRAKRTKADPQTVPDKV